MSVFTAAELAYLRRNLACPYRCRRLGSSLVSAYR